VLLLILAAAVIGKANSVAVAVCILLLVKLLNVDKFVYPVIEKQGMFWGLALLTMAILIPIAKGSIQSKQLMVVFTSLAGILALLLSLLTTYLSGVGVQFLTVQGHSEVMPALILGAVIAAAFLGGVPVGPFITSGILAVVVKLFSKN
jgi:uncharacterized membrane protein (DUF441 family)